LSRTTSNGNWATMSTTSSKANNSLPSNLSMTSSIPQQLNPIHQTASYWSLSKHNSSQPTIHLWMITKSKKGLTSFEKILPVFSLLIRKSLQRKLKSILFRNGFMKRANKVWKSIFTQKEPLSLMFTKSIVLCSSFAKYFPWQNNHPKSETLLKIPYLQTLHNSSLT
jgi:hypothetical protein